MIRYWLALLQGRFKVWQLGALGVLWVGMGAGVLIALGIMALPIAGVLAVSGVAHWVLAARAVKLQDQLEGKLEQLEAREAKRRDGRVDAWLNEDMAPEAPAPAPPPPLPPPPRIGDDPFRNPPAAAPIVVVQTAAPPREVPVAAGNPDDKPKILG